MTKSFTRRVHVPPGVLIFFATVLCAIYAIGDTQEPIPVDPEQTNDSGSEVIEARWYTVELLVFAQNTIIEDNPENWPTYPILNQSSPLIDLVYPIEEPSDESTDEEQTILSEEPDTQPGDTPLEVELPKSPEDLTPFATLPAEQHILTEYAEKIELDQRTRVLFHMSWNHPILSDELAIPVRIIGGDTFGNLNELSGWIDIHVSRYLHVETNLYLTDIIESNNPFDLVTGNNNFKTDIDNASLNTLDMTAFDGISLFSSDEFDVNKKPLDPNTDYLYQVAVKSAHMSEKRRLRSKELHYIDNPKFGLLMYFTPIEFAEEVLEEEAVD